MAGTIRPCRDVLGHQQEVREGDRHAPTWCILQEDNVVHPRHVALGREGALQTSSPGPDPGTKAIANLAHRSVARNQNLSCGVRSERCPTRPGVLQRQCLGRRIPDRETLAAGIAVWERQRSRSHAQVNQMFTIDRARDKMARTCPRPGACEESIRPSKPP